MKIYVASSWRNKRQPDVVRALSKEGHEVYDFRNPSPGYNGFHWSEVDPEWEDWGASKYKRALDHPVVEQDFRRDFNAMQWADAFALVMPCGRSAHLEAGWAIGQGKPTCILLENRNEPELMYKMADHLALTQLDLLAWANKVGSRTVANLVPCQPEPDG